MMMGSLNFWKKGPPIVYLLFLLLLLPFKTLGQGDNTLEASATKQNVDWWRNALIYRLRSSENLSVKGPVAYFYTWNGTSLFVCFVDIKDNLHYFHWLGVTALWLNGYDVTELSCHKDANISTPTSPLEDLIKLSTYYSLKILLDFTSTGEDNVPALSQYSDLIRCWLLSKEIAGISFSINSSPSKGQLPVKYCFMVNIFYNLTMYL